MSKLNSAMTDFIAEALLQRPKSITQILGGGNNQVYRVSLESGEHYALKSYHVDQYEKDLFRMRRELDSFSFLYQCDEKQIPQVVAFDHKQLLALYSWIDGNPITEITHHDILVSVDFISRLKQYSKKNEAKKMLLASDHALSIENVFSQIDRRIHFFEKDAADHMTLQGFLKKKFKPLYHKVRGQFYQKNVLGWESLPLEKAILSPSDFGCHNMLKNENNAIFFIDFEYFGWEDPAALLAHFLLHPSMQLSEKNRALFYEKLSSLYSEDPLFQKRFHTLFYLLGFAWVLIILNEFLPYKQKHRLSAGRFSREDIAHIQTTQLKKATQRFEQLEKMEQSAYLENRMKQGSLC